MATVLNCGLLRGCGDSLVFLAAGQLLTQGSLASLVRLSDFDVIPRHMTPSITWSGSVNTRARCQHLALPF